MAKFAQNTLNQVAGFDAQILAQNLIYNQKDFWNFNWSTITSYTSGWTTGTTPVDLTGASIDAQIIRREITDFHDSRTGLDFQIHDYPIVPLITAVTSTATSTNVLTCTTTDDMFVGMPVRFTGVVFGNVVINTTYYVKEIITSTTFTISDTRGAAPTYTVGSVFALTTASGTMNMVRVSPSPINLTITNVVNAAGTFTLSFDDATWAVIAGDPELDINATEPACFTGRIKISFPAVGTQPAYDEAVFLLFLVNSDGVVNYG
jgi:hypothetical protein